MSLLKTGLWAADEGERIRGKEEEVEVAVVRQKEVEGRMKGRQGQFVRARRERREEREKEVEDETNL